MKYTEMLVVTSFAAMSGYAIADEEVTEFNEVVVLGKSDKSKEIGIYGVKDGIDNGKRTLNSEAIEAASDGTIDTTEFLKYLPNVQMDVTRDEVSQENEQNIRPSDFTISGGNTYDNNIQIDGIGNNSIMDTMGNAPGGDIDEIRGQTAQTLYVHPSLVEGIEVYDSNVSAEKGNFTGGVVNYKLREPKKEFHFDVSMGYQNDSMVKYKKVGSEGDDPGDKPEFTKQTQSVSFDLPLTDKLFVLASYSRATSEVDYKTNSPAIEEKNYLSQDTSENFLLKALYDVDSDRRFTASVIYSPYESEYRYSNKVNSDQLAHSDGLQTSIEYQSYDYGFDWKTLIAYNKNDSSREWSPSTTFWDSRSEYQPEGCNGCIEGGWGDKKQLQEDYSFEIQGNHEFFGGDLGIGYQGKYIEAQSYRPEDVDMNIAGRYNANGTYNCNGAELCYPDFVTTMRIEYPSYEADVSVMQHALWSEYEREFGSVVTRLGVRYDHDDFLKNHNVAPRFVTSWQATDYVNVTLGANRYYSNSMVGYALLEKYPAQKTLMRTVIGDDVDDWFELSSYQAVNYSDSDLDTPYSDELSLAFSFDTPLDGKFTVKGLRRFYEDQFTGSKLEDNTNVMTNEGESTYDSIGVEWGGNYDDWYFTVNATWSETHSEHGGDYFNYYNDPRKVSNMVYYDGQIMSEAAISELIDRQNFAAPITANLFIGKRWWDNRAFTTLLTSYRGAYENIENSNNDIEVDGESYDKYEYVKRKAYVEVNLNNRLQVYKSNHGVATLELRIKNLLDNSPETSTSNSIHYERGRSYWIGAEYSY